MLFSAGITAVAPNVMVSSQVSSSARSLSRSASAAVGCWSSVRVTANLAKLVQVVVVFLTSA